MARFESPFFSRTLALKQEPGVNLGIPDRPRELTGRALPSDPALGNILGRVRNLFPALRDIDLKVEAGRVGQSGRLEAFPKEEAFNPNFGETNTIQVRDPSLVGKSLETTILGEALHFLPKQSKQFAKLKQKFVKSLSPDQMQFARERHAFDAVNFNEERSFEEWFEQVWSDALIRGFIAPDERREFIEQGAFEEQNIPILEEMIGFLRGKK